MARSSLAIFSFWLISVSAQAASLPEAVKVGVVLRTAPEVNSFASDLNQGIELAAENFNDESKKLKIELVKYPYQSGSAALDKVANQLTSDQVHFAIGGEMSDEALSLSDHFKSKSVLFMSPTASHPAFSNAGNLNFQGSYSDNQLAKAAARFISAVRPNAHLGVLHNSGNAYSDYLTNAFMAEFEILNPKNAKPSVSEFRYSGENPDFKSAAKKFKDSNVDLVIAFVLQEALKNFVRSAEALQYQPTYLGGDGWGTDESIFKALPHFHGIRNAYWHPEVRSAATQKWSAQFQKKFGHPPNAWNAVAYDSALALFESMTHSSLPLSAAQVADKLSEIRVSKSVSVSSLHFDHSHTAVRPFFWYELEKGKTHFLKEMQP